jgi:hypothetical protein
MSRVIRNWKPDRVEDTPVAEHRYRWDTADETWKADSYREWLALVPYKVGEVIMVSCGDHALRTRILDVLSERDRFGDRREVYRVQYETKSGLWAKLYQRIHPGFVQRGYWLAGLAPDLDVAFKKRETLIRLKESTS